MARIVQKGIKKPKVFRGTCHECGAIIEEFESKLTVQPDRDGPLAKFTCLQCNNGMWLYPYSEERS